jgi:hypothetical protein
LKLPEMRRTTEALRVVMPMKKKKEEEEIFFCYWRKNVCDA